MMKETIICVVIVIAIVIGSIITQKYTTETVETFTKKLKKIKEDIVNIEEQNEVQLVEIKNKIKNIEKEWNKRHNKLAYFIEHDELEKIETNITGLRSFVDTKEYPEAICELETGIFILNHLEEKYALSLQNIF